MADKDATIDVDELNDDDFAKLKDDLSTGELAGEADAGKTDAAAAEVAETDEASTDAAVDDDDEETGGKSETVPHGKYHHERERRKTAEQKAEKLAERLQQLIEAQAANAVAKPAEEAKAETDEPDPANPLEQISWLVKKYTEGEKTRAKETEQRAADGERQQFAQGVKSLEDEFKKTNTDYDAALEFVAQSRDEELQLMFPTATADQRRQYILGEWNNVIRQSVAAGVNPAQQIYSLAQRRGYKKADAAVSDVSTVEKLAKQEEARQASLSLGKSGGGIVNTEKMSPEQLLEMSDEDFAAYKKKFGGVARAFAA